MSNPNSFYITTPIYYVNDVPHIGHAYTTIAADVLARYWRLRGRDVFFLTGLDEHGQKVQQAAAKAGLEPKAYCDLLEPRFKELWKRLNISYNKFIRTTNQKHEEIVQRYLQQLYDTRNEKGDRLIYPKEYTGWYCTFDERFWTEKDVIEGLCPDCKRPVERLSESNYFFRMSQYQTSLIEHIENACHFPEFIRPNSRHNEVLGFLRKPLEDLSISRPKFRLSWGIDLPFAHDYVTYVWFDALVNYISALEYLNQNDTKYWPTSDDKNHEVLHLVGKDILTTHAVYWSTMLMALGLELPTTIFAHGWWTVNGEKMSKSRGNVVDPNSIIDEFGGPDPFRYFLLREIPFGQDGDFSCEAMTQRYNSELANDLGNLLSRTLTLLERFAGGVIPQPQISHPQEQDVSKIARGLPNLVEEALNSLEFNRALSEIWVLVKCTNVYVEQMAPWNLAKSPTQRPLLDTVLYTAAQALRCITIYLWPFMPQTSEKIILQLGLAEDFKKPLLTDFSWGGGNIVGAKISKDSPLFPRIETTTGSLGFKKALGAKLIKGEPRVIEQPTNTAPDSPTATPSEQSVLSSTQLPQIPQITIDEFMKIQLKTAKVLAAERVPKSEKLLKLQVSLGEGTEPRQIVAGIGKKYTPEALIGKTIIIVANLKPAKLMGIESQGMVLAAGDSEVRGLATFLEEVDPGTKVK